MPTVAGILDIISGGLALLGAIILIFLGFLGGGILRAFDLWPFEAIPLIFLSIFGIPLLAMGAISLIGGICSVQRRNWGLALAGSITSAFLSQALGIVAIILVALSKDEFLPSRS